MPAIKADGLTRRFDDLVAVDDLALSVEEGEIFGLVGPDGARKTTAMRRRRLGRRASRLARG